VVGDDVEVQLHAARVYRVGELAHVRLGAEVRIDGGEIRDPVAVVPGALLARPTLHRLVLVDRPQPDGGGAQALDVVEFRGEALQVAAMIEALVRRIEAGGQAVALQAAPVVGRVAVRKAVGQHEVDDLVFGQPFTVVGRREGNRCACAKSESRQ
jgi:hypothetical protein